MKAISKRRGLRRIWMIGVALLLLILVFFGNAVLAAVGRYLVLEQNPEHVDLIVILNGRDTERILGAVDLYDAGYAPLIVLARTEKQPGTDAFWERVGERFDRRGFSTRAVEALGVPESDFRLIGEKGVKGTYEEAEVVRRFVERNGLKSIMIVTSKWHSKRAYETFRKVLNSIPQIRIRVCPTKYDAFKPDSWWKEWRQVALVVSEYVKFGYYIAALRASPGMLHSG